MGPLGNEPEERPVIDEERRHAFEDA